MTLDLLNLYFVIYLWITQTVVSSTNTLIVCGNNYDVITCDCGLIQINYASFGRHDRITCSDAKMSDINCHASSSQSVVEQLCQGKHTCTVPATKATFGGDPCRQTYKYLIIEYDSLDPMKGYNVNGNEKAGLFNLEFQVPILHAVGDLIISRKSGSLTECLSRNCVTNEHCNSAIFDPVKGICHTFTSPNGNSTTYQFTESEEIWSTNKLICF